MSRLTTLLVICGTFIAVAAQEPASRKQRPTLTNDDLRLEQGAALAVRQTVTGDEIIRLLEHVQSFRSRAIIDTMEWTIDVVTPDRFRAVGRRPGVGTSQFVTVGNSRYSLAAGASNWQSFKVANEMDVARQYISDFLLSWFSSLRLKARGFEPVEGTNALAYEVDQPPNRDLQYVKVWLRFDDGLPLRIVLSSSKEGRPRYTVTFYDYNQPISIEPPIR